MEKTGQVENVKFPWFKERLKTKYLRDLRQTQQLSGALDSRKWRFLSPGLDDFRDGYPTVSEELLTQCKCGPSPAVFGVPNHACSVKFPQKRLSKSQVCYSKQNPQSQAQREFIDAVEHKLKQHPLALYPHLESGLTPELFDCVLSVLDPDMCVKEELSITSSTEEMEHLKENKAQCEFFTPETIKPSITIKPQTEKCKDVKPKNPFKWQRLKRTLVVKDYQTASGTHLLSVSQEDDKQMITKLFCEWITSLGGETSDLTESIILDLFKSDYEKKPSETLPINKNDPNQTIAIFHSSIEEHNKDLCVKELSQACKPNRLQAANDPQALSEITECLDFEEQLSEQYKELKQIHGIQAFREFIIKKGVRMPKFLSAVFSEDEQKRIRGSTSSSKGKAVY